jgi:cystathionine gamma-synthase
MAPVNVGVELSVTFQHGPDDNYYLRQASSATIVAFEDAIGALEGGVALAFSSGMAATTAVVESMPVGTVALAPAASYSGTATLFATQEQLGRMKVREVDLVDTDAVLAALPGTDLVWLESPSNPLMGVADLPVIVEAAHGAGAIVAMDSTFNTPFVLRPFAYGVDIVMHSATKYLSGHSDALMGVLVTRDGELGARLRARRDLTGAIPGALESYLALRGLRTLSLRMQRAQENALELAVRLAAHPDVTRVRFPGLPDDLGHDRATRLHDGYGAMLAFEVAGGAAVADELCRAVQLISHATSLGGVETLIERRAMHAVDAARATPANLLRLSVGIEHVEDLWADLAQALALTQRPR